MYEIVDNLRTWLMVSDWGKKNVVLSDAPVGEKLAREYGWKLDVDGIDYQDDKKAWWL